MCRFLIVKSKTSIRPQNLLKDFAIMCQKSRTTDGDRQGDGWGFAWLNLQGKWQLQKSLLPIWKDLKKFKTFPSTALFVAHARSASFSDQKEVIEYNEPYISNKYCFVFNGVLKGVRTRQKIKGKIGAQKIWNLLQHQLKNHSPSQALTRIHKFLKENTKEIYGLNIGLVTKNNIFALCGQNCNQEYFTLRIAFQKNKNIICSEEINEYKFRRMKAKEIIKL